MEPLIAYGSTVVRGLRGDYGVIGAYGAVQRLFITFGLTAGPACFFINAPFGRWADSSFFTINGNVGWLLMELVSPLTLLIALTTSPTSSTSPLSSFTLDLPQRIISAFTSLPRARALLAGLFLTHYLNRAVISTWRNPGRARMDISVPISAALFNLANGGMMGLWLAGGENLRGGNPSGSWGLRDGPFAQLGFGLGVALWAAGFIGNIVCDEMLYDLKRNKMRQGAKSKNQSPKERYSIPRGFLYEYVSHPSYSTEWVEWTGFTLASLCLAPSPFPSLALSSLNSPTFRASLSSLFKASSSPFSILRNVPHALRPFPQWYLQPPAIFVLQEVMVMFPRAVINGIKGRSATNGQSRGGS